MRFDELMTELERDLSGEESRQVLAALRQDPLVWQSLEQPVFWKLLVERAAVEGAGNRRLFWSPGRLALLALGEARPLENLATDPLAPIGQAVQEKAVQFYQAAQRTGRPPASLREAGLLALALRERRRLTGTWGGLLNELFPRQSPGERSSAEAPAAWHAVWRTPLACLVSMVPDPEDLLRALLPKTLLRPPYEWISHACLSQPVDEETRAHQLLRVMQGLPAAVQLALLRTLTLSGGETLSETLSGRLLIGHPAFANLRGQVTPADLDLTGLSNRALSLQQMGAFYQLSGDSAQALSLYQLAGQTLEQWLAGLTLQRMSLLDSDLPAGSSNTMNQPGVLLPAAMGWLNEDLGVMLLSHTCAAEVLDQVPTSSDSPFMQIKRALLLFGQQPALARDLARQGADGLLEAVNRRGLPFSGEFVYTWRPQDALQILLDLDLPEDALALSHALLRLRPVDIDLLRLAAEIEDRLGRLEPAIEYAASVVALRPEDLMGRRALADRLGRAGRWEKSFAMWQSLLALTESPIVADRLACAQAALQAAQPADAAALARAVLETEPNNGAAQGLAGLALVTVGDPQQALPYLVQSTLLAPETLAPWLALARIQQEQAEPQRALETLRAAVTAVPEDPAGHLALGQACLTAGLLSEALPHLKKAYLLLPASEDLALLYGRTLRTLGHPSEARAVLEGVRAAWNRSPELAYEYAQVMLDLNEAEAALPVLEIALRSGLPVLDGYLLYARVLMGEYRTGEEVWDQETVHTRLQQASQALNRILEVDSNNLEARFLKADILRENGELESALEMYRALAGSGEPELRWRVQWGLGRTALRLGQIDIALAAFKEACQARPDHLALQRGLAETSLRALLTKEALIAADDALRLAADDVENLDWYASFVAGMGEARRAVSALERAVQIDPYRPDLLVSLAQWQLSAGDLPGARENLAKLQGMEKVGRANLRRAAHIYLRLEDPRAALACFEHALAAGVDLPADLLFETARLYETTGNLEAALELSQKALDDTPASLPVYLLQVDLLMRVNRPQAALAQLERAQRIAQSAKTSDATLAEIYGRFTRLMLLENNLPTALHYAEKVLLLRPDDHSARYQAADLSLALLQHERAMNILLPVSIQSPARLMESGQVGLDLLCLQVEAALEWGQLTGLVERIAEGLDFIRTERRVGQAKIRLLAAQSRMLARSGTLADARQAYGQACDAEPKTTSAGALWLAEAALESQRWQEALTLFEGCARSKPSEARALFGLARALVLSAECQRTCAALDVRSNAPGPQTVSEDSYHKFDEAIQAAGKLANTADIGRWRVRGLAAFSPSAQTARSMAALPHTPQDTAALIAVLRQIDNQVAAVQVARRFEQDAGVLLQLAMCYLKEPNAEGLAVAERAAAADPSQPLAHVVRAMLEQQAGELVKALDSCESALALWPDEPAWHDLAGSLCLQIGQVQPGLLHRRRAQELDPHSPRMAFKLGQACLADEDLNGAIEALERSRALDGNQSDVCLTLATAYHMADRLPQALEAARLASQLDPASADSLLIAGEIALSMDRSDEALQFGQDAIRREPDNAGAALFLSNVHVMRGQTEAGLAVLEDASPAVKAVFPVAFDRAKLIRRLHGPQAAVDVLEKLAREHPEEPGLLGYLARTQADCGEVKAAERYAFKALRLDPNQPDLTLMLGRLQRKSGQLDQAVYLLAEAIRMAPENLEAYLELGEVYQDRREYPLALKVYSQAMNVAPGDYRSFYLAGLIQRDSKDYSSAEAMLRRAAELAPNNLTIRRQLVGVIALNLVHTSKQEISLS